VDSYHGFAGFQRFSHGKSILKAKTLFDLQFYPTPFKFLTLASGYWRVGFVVGDFPAMNPCFHSPEAADMSTTQSWKATRSPCRFT